MEFTKEMVDSVNRMSTLEALLNFDSLWKVITSSGYIGAICNVALGIAFFTTLAAILKAFYHNGGSCKIVSYTPQIIKMILVTSMFCIPDIYSKWTRHMAGLSTVLNGRLTADIMFSFQVQFRSFLYSVQSVSESAGAVELKTASPLNLLLSTLNNYMITIYFIVISIGPAFLIIAMLMAPLCMAISLFLPNVGYNWTKFFIASMFFTVFTSIGIMAIGISGITQLAADHTFGDSFIMAIIMMLTIIVVLSTIPMVIATVFHVPLFNCISKLIGLLLLPLGVFPVLLKCFILNMVFKNSSRKSTPNLGRA